MDMLLAAKVCEPFSRNDPQSPFFEELESVYPDVTWRNVNADGSFRPIFRKTNPLVKLGLTTDETENAYVTPMGDELLAGTAGIPEVYTYAAKSHRERDGTPSMALMCAAALELPDEVFTLEDTEFGVSDSYDSSTSNARSVVDSVRSQRLVFGSNSSVRQRRLRNFMAAIVSSGAMKQVDGGWQLNDINVALDIASAIGANTSPNATVSPEENSSPMHSETGIPQPPRRAPSANVRSISPGDRKQITIRASVDSVSDPVQRALLLERANNTHEQLVQEVADIIRSNGCDPLEDSNSFDVALEGDYAALIEIKTIKRSNCISQIRKAVSQLPEYRWRHREKFGPDSKQIIVLSEDPLQYIDEEYMEYLTEDRGMIIAWKAQDALVDSSGQSLEEILFPSQ